MNNVFPQKNVENNIALIFTSDFTKIGKITYEKKNSKIEKFLPEFKRVIEVKIWIKISRNIVYEFVVMDLKEGIDENGKMDLERIMVWANFIDNLKIERIINTEIEKIINICNEQILKSRQKENEKKRKRLKKKVKILNIWIKRI